MTFFEAILLGVVEGFTEFLPISSTAHLIVISRVLDIPHSGFLPSFVIAIQLGAIGAVIFLYWRTLVFDLEIVKRVVVAFIPTACIGVLLYTFLKEVLIENLWVIALALLSGGIVLIMFERFYRSDNLGVLSYRNAFLIGLAQSVAIIPGISRAGATILGGLALGLSREKIVEFSFLLAIPTMFAATGFDLYKSGSLFAKKEWELLAVGFVVSFIAAYAGIRWLIRFVQTHSFASFGWYRVLLGGTILIFLAVQWQ